MAENSVAMKPSLTEELLLLRRRKRWSHEEVAAALMVSPGSIRLWEDPERVPFPEQKAKG